MVSLRRAVQGIFNVGTLLAVLSPWLQIPDGIVHTAYELSESAFCTEMIPNCMHEGTEYASSPSIRDKEAFSQISSRVLGSSFGSHHHYCIWPQGSFAPSQSLSTHGLSSASAELGNLLSYSLKVGEASMGTCFEKSMFFHRNPLRLSESRQQEHSESRSLATIERDARILRSRL